MTSQIETPFETPAIYCSGLFRRRAGTLTLTESKVEFRPKGSTEPAVQIALRDVLDVASSHEVVRDHSLWLKVGLTPTPTAMLAKRVRERIMGHRAMAIRTESGIGTPDNTCSATISIGRRTPERGPQLHRSHHSLDLRSSVRFESGRREYAYG